MNTEGISKLLSNLRGLGIYRDKFDEGILVNEFIKDLPEFNLPIQQTFACGASIDVLLWFRKTSLGGAYYLHKYRATDPITNRGHNFFMAHALITMREAFNLLQGRAVEKEFNLTEGGIVICWIKLDFHEHDGQGGYKYVKYILNDIYDLDKVLDIYPIKEAANADDKYHLVRNLKRGDIIPVTFALPKGEEKKLIEANPEFRILRIYCTPKKRGKGSDGRLASDLEIVPKDGEGINTGEDDEDQDADSENEAKIAV